MSPRLWYGQGRSMTRETRVLVNPKATTKPPDIPEGKVRCPVCRNTTSLTPAGRLRKHRDMFKNDCYNKRVSS